MKMFACFTFHFTFNCKWFPEQTGPIARCKKAPEIINILCDWADFFWLTFQDIICHSTNQAKQEIQNDYPIDNASVNKC